MPERRTENNGLSPWWGRFLLILLGGFFLYSLVSSYLGFGVPPVGKTGKHIRKGSKHVTRTYRGYYFGGGMGVGK